MRHRPGVSLEELPSLNTSGRIATGSYNIYGPFDHICQSNSDDASPTGAHCHDWFDQRCRRIDFDVTRGQSAAYRR